MTKLAHYIEKQGLRLVDFFNKFDKDGSMSVTHEEFVEGIEVCGASSSPFAIHVLYMYCRQASFSISPFVVILYVLG